MRSRIPTLSLTSLALAGAIVLAIIFARPIPKASAAAPQNNSAAKQSAQVDTKTDTKSDSKSEGKSSPAQAPPASSSIEKRVEDFLRKWYAWGPDFQLKIGPVKPSPAGDLYEVPVVVTAQGGSDAAIVYVPRERHS